MRTRPIDVEERLNSLPRRRPESEPESDPDSERGSEPSWVAPDAAWVPLGSRLSQARAAFESFLPLPLRGAHWNPGRRGVAAVALLGVAAIAFASVLFMRGRPHSVGLQSPGPVPVLPSLSPLPTATPSQASLFVDVEGKVAHPGLEQMTRGARVADALAAAGGALHGVDTTSLNLARSLVDGEQIRVGLPGSVVPPSQPVSAPGSATSQSEGPRVALNTATLAQLDGLPGVGPVTAQHILDWRSQHGPFTSVEQLQEVTGIGPSLYAKLSPLVTV